MAQALNDRIKKLLSEKRIPKTEISKKLGIGYSTLWRRLNGERSLDVDFLIELAEVLGTSPSYLLDGSDNVASAGIPDMHNVLVQSNASANKITTEPSRLIYKNGDVMIDIPDTPMNKQWFDDFLTKVMTTESDKAIATV